MTQQEAEESVVTFLIRQANQMHEAERHHPSTSDDHIRLTGERVVSLRAIRETVMAAPLHGGF